ncbi:hypothetical protein DIPPA_18114 [Diplonema papillatum]|nr:hypothetical protein DIPPA_18114 [Diplonema papillatum]
MSEDPFSLVVAGGPVPPGVPGVKALVPSWQPKEDQVPATPPGGTSAMMGAMKSGTLFLDGAAKQALLSDAARQDGGEDRWPLHHTLPNRHFLRNDRLDCCKRV